MQAVTYDRNYFYINGRKEKIVAGAVHYFRTPCELWEDRIIKAKQAGLNTIETYLCWNWHEAEKGKWDFAGDRNLDAFFSLCEKHGLYIIARPGPYICSEWDNGGLPPYLNAIPGIKLRDYDRKYLIHVDRYLDKVMPIIVKHQIDRGGNIILVQDENEYLFPKRAGGKKYLEYLRDGMRKRGITVPIFGCNFIARPVKDVLETFNWSSGFKAPAAAYRKKFPNNPFFVTEFWCGWFDEWGSPRNLRKDKVVTDALAELYKVGGHVCYYMFHGGTNWGFFGGRTQGSDRVFMTTSYDYGAPLTECGFFSPRYESLAKQNFKVRGAKYVKAQKPSSGGPKLPKLSSWKKGGIKLSALKSLNGPASFEKLGNYLGYGVYKASYISAEERKTAVYFPEYADRITVFSNKENCGTFGRGKDVDRSPITLKLKKGRNDFIFFADNMGRFNYGLKLGEQKGLLGPVYLDAAEERLVWTFNDEKNWKVTKDKKFELEIYSPGKELQFMWDAPRKKIVRAVAEFNSSEGAAVNLSMTFPGSTEMSIFVNGKQVYYHGRLHLTCGILEKLITKFVKPGKNTLEVWSSDVDFMNTLRSVRVVNCKTELKKNWAFAKVESESTGKTRLGAMSTWTCSFKMKAPKTPVCLRLDGMGKGQLYFNGKNIGRYWQIGPQRDYYLPEPWFKDGKNEIVLFEEQGKTPEKVSLVYNKGKFEIVK